LAGSLSVTASLVELSESAPSKVSKRLLCG
jgi:hypothetical protein